MKNNKKKMQGKSKWIVISTVLFAVLGVLCLLFGFAFLHGWDYVLSWFTSRWAVYLYILIGIIGFVVAWIVYKIKMGEE